MGFRPEQEDFVKSCYTMANERIGGFYESSMYGKFYERCDDRDRAYYFQHDSKVPAWRSKMYFGIYFLGVKVLESQFDESLRMDPMIQVGLEPGRGYDQAALQKAEVAHFDLNHDLYMGGFRSVNSRIQWYATVYGTGIGREYFVSRANEDEFLKIEKNSFGERQEKRVKKFIRKENTVTEAVDPRNFAHDPTKSEFSQSRWTSVRYPLPVQSIYAMRGDERFYQPGVNELIKKIEVGGDPVKWNKGKNTYFSRNEDDTGHQNSVIVDEYSGDLPVKGNMGDQSLYYMLIVRAYNIVLAIRKSPFVRHPYWKERPYPDPNGPYGVDPCATLVPLGKLKNNVVNQMNDMVNSSLKYMYEIYDGNIRGGASALISGLPGGLVLAQNAEAFEGQLVRAVKKESQIPHMNDLINYVDRYEQTARPASSGRGRDDSLNKTAYAIGVMTQREDAGIASMQGRMDLGIEDAMGMKMVNRVRWSTQPVEHTLEGRKSIMQYYPGELGGVDFTYKARRVTAEIQSAKYLSYLKLAMGGLKAGIVQPQGLARLMRVIGRSLNIDEVDDVINIAAGMPPQVNNEVAEVEGGENVLEAA